MRDSKTILKKVNVGLSNTRQFVDVHFNGRSQLNPLLALVERRFELNLMQKYRGLKSGKDSEDRGWESDWMTDRAKSVRSQHLSCIVFDSANPSPWTWLSILAESIFHLILIKMSY